MICAPFNASEIFYSGFQTCWMQYFQSNANNLLVKFGIFLLFRTGSTRQHSRESARVICVSLRCSKKSALRTNLSIKRTGHLGASSCVARVGWKTARAVEVTMVSVHKPYVLRVPGFSAVSIYMDYTVANPESSVWSSYYRRGTKRERDLPWGSNHNPKPIIGLLKPNIYKH